MGTKIAVRIAQLGLLKGDVAKQAKIAPGTLTQIVKGESIPSLPVALRLARVLDMTVEELWGYLVE
jgi:DNA-binding XRE family transcriptional regulator